MDIYEKERKKRQQQKTKITLTEKKHTKSAIYVRHDKLNRKTLKTEHLKCSN